MDSSQNLTDKGTIRREGSKPWRTLRDFTFSHILEGWKRNGWLDLWMAKDVFSSPSIRTRRSLPGFRFFLSSQLYSISEMSSCSTHSNNFLGAAWFGETTGSAWRIGCEVWIT